MQTRHQNKLILLLLTVLIGSILILAFFVFTLKSQGANDLKVLLNNQKITTALNSKYVDVYKDNESMFNKELNRTVNPLELTKTITKIYNTNNNIVTTYKGEIASVKTELQGSLEAWKSGITKDTNFENKEKVLQDVEKLKLEADKIVEFKDLEAQKASFSELQKTYQVQLDVYNKKAFINGVKSSQGEVNDLINYLQVNNLADGLGKVQKYKTEVEALSQDAELAKYSYIDLETKVNRDLKPLLADGFTVKSNNEEAIRVKNTTVKPASTNNNIPIKNGKLILVKKGEQHMYIYQDGVLLRDNPVTTGRINWPTDTGTFSILTKERSRRLQGSGQGATWNVFVNYWMLFNAAEEEGIHDAPWRNGIFGNPLTDTNGSRGCVNTPDDTIGWLFDWANIGTPVVVQD